MQTQFLTDRRAQQLVGLAALPVAALGGIAAASPGLSWVVVIGLLVLLLVGVAHQISFPLVLAAAVLVYAASYRGLIYASQVSVGGVVITPFDALWAYVIARYLLLPRRKRAGPVEGYIMIGVALLTTVSGLLWDQAVYDILKLLRTQLFLAFAILIGASLSASEHLTVFRALVAGALITSIAQLATFFFALRGINIWAYLGISASGHDVFQIIDPSLTSSFRDNGVVINFALFGLLVLLGFAATKVALVRSTTTVALSAVFIIATALSLTRSNWLALVACLMLWVIISGGMSNKAVLNFGMWALMLAAVGLTALETSNEGRVVALVEERILAYSTGTDGNTLGERASEAQAAWQSYTQSPILGIGAASITLDSDNAGSTISEARNNQFHNGFLQYLVGGGAVAFAALLWVLASALRAAWRKVNDQVDLLVRATGLACFLVIAGTVLLSLTTGAINDFQQVTIIGIIVGIALNPPKQI